MHVNRQMNLMNVLRVRDRTIKYRIKGTAIVISKGGCLSFNFIFITKVNSELSVEVEVGKYQMDLIQVKLTKWRIQQSIHLFSLSSVNQPTDRLFLNKKLKSKVLQHQF